MNNKIMIFCAARTGSVSLGHCIRHSLGSQVDPWYDFTCEEPFNSGRMNASPAGSYEANLTENIQKIITRDLYQGETFFEPHITEQWANFMTRENVNSYLDKIYSDKRCVKHIHNPLYVNRINMYIIDYCKANSIKVVWIWREDIWSQFMSLLMSRQEQCWSMLCERDRGNLQKAVYKPYTDYGYMLEEYARFTDRLYIFPGYFKSIGLDYYDLKFEEYLGDNICFEDRVNIVKDVFDYIGVTFIMSDKIEEALGMETQQHKKGQWEKLPDIDKIKEALHYEG